MTGMTPVLLEDAGAANLVDVSRRHVRLQPGEVPAKGGRVPDVAGDEAGDLRLVLDRLRYRHRSALRQSPGAGRRQQERKDGAHSSDIIKTGEDREIGVRSSEFGVGVLSQ